MHIFEIPFYRTNFCLIYLINRWAISYVFIRNCSSFHYKDKLSLLTLVKFSMYLTFTNGNVERATTFVCQETLNRLLLSNKYLNIFQHAEIEKGTDIDPEIMTSGSSCSSNMHFLSFFFWILNYSGLRYILHALSLIASKHTQRI